MWKTDMRHLIGLHRFANENLLCGFPVRKSQYVYNKTQDSDVLNIHCDLTSDSVVDGEESDIIFSLGTSTLKASYGFRN